MRFMQGLVYGFWDEPTDPLEGLQKETATEKWQRYAYSDMSDCSDPEVWQEVHHHGDGEDEFGSPGSMEDEDWLADHITARSAALKRARHYFQLAEARSDYEMMCHYENIIDTLTVL